MTKKSEDSGYVLAIDGGGSKTTVWCSDLAGKVVGEFKCGPMSLAATTEKQAVANLHEAVEESTKTLGKHITFEQVVLGLAGVDTQQELEDAQELFRKALEEKYIIKEFTLVNDIFIALESGTSSLNAVCLISGTGSNCFGRCSMGETAKTGGMDYLLSDQGSGFDIGQQVLRAAVKSYDGRSKKTLLEKLLCEHFKIESIEDVKDKVYNPRLNKTQIAQISQLCFQARELHDTIANEIINKALDDLCEMVATVLRRLELSQADTDVVLVGGIATDPYMKQHLELRLKQHFRKLQFIVPEHPPVYGAMQLALRMVDSN